MPGSWDASSERKLLLCIIGLQSKLKWNVIAQRMGEMFTEEACRSHETPPLRHFQCATFHVKSQVEMPFNWTAERERQMLLLAICEANLKPTMETWAIVAKILGGGITPSAVSQKYYKLKRESDKLAGTTSASTKQVKDEAITDTASARPTSGRGQKRKSDEEEPSGSLKRVRKARQRPGQNKSQDSLGPIKLEKGAVSWASDDETPAPLQIAHAQDIE